MKFININRLLALSFKNDDDPARNCFDEYYMPLVKIKDFNAITDNKPSFIKPVKNKQEMYEERKWNIANDQSNANYDAGNEIILIQKS